MKCPDNILEPLTEIITLGLLNIRAAAVKKDSERCMVESNHIHNLPSLISNYSEDLLKFYLHVEKTQFQKESVSVNLYLFEQQWSKLQN
jgi:hypothetical protein